jgi:hypothetical protein
MSANKITYEDKTTGEVNPRPGNQKVTSGDMNQIKFVVNSHADDIDALDGGLGDLQGDVTALQGDIVTVQGDITTLQGDVSSLDSYRDSIKFLVPVAAAEVESNYTISRSVGDITLSSSAANTYTITVPGVNSTNAFLHLSLRDAGRITWAGAQANTVRISTFLLDLNTGDYVAQRLPFFVTVYKVSELP